MSLQDERVSIVEEMMVMKRTCAFVRINYIVTTSVHSEVHVKRMLMVVL